MVHWRDVRDSVLGVIGVWRVRDWRVGDSSAMLRGRVGRVVMCPC